MNWFNYSNTNNINTLAFNIYPLTVWFSYKTPVAFKIDGNGIIMLDFKGSKTTSKHLNLIKQNEPIVKLVNKEEFDAIWEKEVQINLDRLKCKN